MTAELDQCGTGDLNGNILNSKCQISGRKMCLIGTDMYYQVTVGDNYDRMMAVVKLPLTVQIL